MTETEADTPPAVVDRPPLATEVRVAPRVVVEFVKMPELEAAPPVVLDPG